MAAPPGLLNVYDVAQRLEVSHASVYRYIEKGQLEVVAEGCQKFIRESDLAKFQPRPRGNPNFSQGKKARRKVEKRIDTAQSGPAKVHKKQAGKKSSN